jgi:glycosyltransferase involved in cell wall biosynthesis
MRVVHAVGWYFPQTMGGTEVYVAAVARELQRAGIDVRVAAPLAGATRAEITEHDGIPVFRYPIPEAPTRAEARGDDVARGAESFHEWLAATSPDIVHVHTFVTGLDLIEIERARSAGTRVFVTSHSSALGYLCLRGTLLRWGTEACDGVIRPRLCAACALQHRGVSRWMAQAAAALPMTVARVADRVDHPVGTGLGLRAHVAARARRQQRLFQQIDGFFALTEAARSMLVANGAPASKVHVNRLGVDRDVVPPCQAARGPRVRRQIKIGYLGRLDPIKGVADLLRAVTHLSNDVPVQVDICGVGEDAAALQVRDACLAAAARDARISLRGPVPREHVASTLASWDLLCCPGLSLEGGPTVALEAFAVGTPVVGTRFGGLAEIVSDGHNGRLVEPGDWQALSTVLRQVAEKPGLIDEWRRHIPAVRSMQDVATDYLEAYRA